MEGEYGTTLEVLADESERKTDQRLKGKHKLMSLQSNVKLINFNLILTH